MSRTVVQWGVGVLVVLSILLLGVFAGEWAVRYRETMPAQKADAIAMRDEVTEGGLALAVPLRLITSRKQWFGPWLETEYSFLGMDNEDNGLATRVYKLHITVNAVNGTIVSATGFPNSEHVRR
ncbi:MAG: hypothetical protein OWT28_03580 [Firmicutes bacterium]|nr:hypothetical protein [Bacillota bacterium]